MIDEQIFSSIMEKCTEKKVISCCKKLVKKSRLTSGTVAQTLCDLAYWLYVYDHIDEALEVCEFSHLDIPKPFTINYNVWDFVLWIWGLEAYIYRKQGDEARCCEMLERIKLVRITPNSEKMDTIEKQTAHVKRICEDLSYDEAINKREIENGIKNGNKNDEMYYRFSALGRMIGYGVTGWYPQLEARKEELEQLINEYISILRK